MTETDQPLRGRAKWEDRYRTGDLPWDTGRPDRHLIEACDRYSLHGGRAIELGCGTGTNAVWLAQAGFTVTAIDISTLALESAARKAADACVGLNLVALDLLAAPLPAGPFDFAFDRGCFHSFPDASERVRVAARIAASLAPGGHWLSLIGSTDGPARDGGPPRRSARDTVEAVEPHFEILELRATHFDSRHETPPTAWLGMFRKRQAPSDLSHSGSGASRSDPAGPATRYRRGAP